MKLKSSKEDPLEPIEKLLKPKLSLFILTTLVCFGPYGNLILGIANQDYSNLIKPALLIEAIFIMLTSPRLNQYRLN